MRKILLFLTICGALSLSAQTMRVYPPLTTTPYSTDLLKATNAAQARARLGITSTNGAVGGAPANTVVGPGPVTAGKFSVYADATGTNLAAASFDPQPTNSKLTALTGTINGLIKQNGSSYIAATPGTDYAPATSGSGILKGDGAGGTTAAVAGTDFLQGGTITGSGLTQSSGKILGRSTAGAGAVQEIAVGTGLDLSGGSLTLNLDENSLPMNDVGQAGMVADPATHNYEHYASGEDGSPEWTPYDFDEFEITELVFPGLTPNTILTVDPSTKKIVSGPPISSASSSAKRRNYITLRFPEMADGTGCTFFDYPTSVLNKCVKFSGTGATNANWCHWMIMVPEDLDQTSEIRLERMTFVLDAADTAAHRYTIGCADVAPSADHGGTVGNYIELLHAGDAAGAQYDSETIANVSLTGWAAALTPGHTWNIKLARDGTDASTEVSDLVAIVISYQSNQ